jgi:hypothetical protein
MSGFNFKYPLLTSLFGIGSILLLTGRVFETEISAFMLGFLESISVVFILGGVSYLAYCAFKRINPLTFDKN